MLQVAPCEPANGETRIKIIIRTGFLFSGFAPVNYEIENQIHLDV